MKRVGDQSAGFALDSYLFYWIGHLDAAYRREMRKALRRVGLTQPAWRALMVLTEQSPMTVTALSDRTVVERTALTRVLDQLEVKGLISRRADSGDRRRTEVHIEPAGRELCDKIIPVASAVAARTVSGLTRHEVAQALDLVRRMTANLGSPAVEALLDRQD